MAYANKQIKELMGFLRKELRENGYGVEYKVSKPTLNGDGSFSLEISSSVAEDNEMRELSGGGLYQTSNIAKATVKRNWELILDGTSFRRDQEMIGEFTAEYVAYIIAARARRKVGVKII